MVRLLALLAAVFLLLPHGAEAQRGRRSPAAPMTQVRVRAQPPGGAPGSATVKRAELLLGWWDGTARIPLTVGKDAEGAFVAVPLHPGVWGDLRALQAPEMALVLLEFDGFVPVVSREFLWLGALGHQGGPVRDTSLAFRGAQPLVVRPGDDAELVVPLRRAVSRQLKFVDDSGTAVTDITVSGGMFWSVDNMCGFPAGNVPLFDDIRPNADGVITVPDGDLEYGIEIRENPYLRVVTPPPFEGSGNFFRMRFDSPEQVVHIRRFSRLPLQVRVFVGESPAAGASLTIEPPAVSGCALEGGERVTTDAQGVWVRGDFYPDQVGAICIADDRGELLWSQSQFDTRTITVSLPEGTRLGVAKGCASP